MSAGEGRGIPARPDSAGELSEAERDELRWLRQENRLLRLEKEMLLKIATGYALERRPW